MLMADTQKPVTQIAGNIDYLAIANNLPHSEDPQQKQLRNQAYSIALAQELSRPRKKEDDPEKIEDGYISKEGEDEDSVDKIEARLEKRQRLNIESDDASSEKSMQEKAITTF